MKNRKSFNSVRFEKGSGKNYVVKSVLSKGNADFFVEVYKMTILETKNLKKYYGKGDTQVKALDGVNLSVEDGEFVAIVGTSGSGKSTLLHMLGGLDRPTSGSVTVDGKNIFSLKDEALTIFRRRKIGFVFQSFNLVPVLTVRDISLTVSFPSALNFFMRSAWDSDGVHCANSIASSISFCSFFFRNDN